MTDNKQQHTPTPWWIDDDGYIAAGHGEDYKTIIDPTCMTPPANEGEIKANAASPARNTRLTKQNINEK